MKPQHPTISTLALVLSLAPCAAPAWGQGAPRELIRKVEFDQNLGARVPLDLPFRDESGAAVRLGDYFGAKPVLLTLGYYECPMLCTLQLNGLARSLKPLAFSAGKEFDIVTVSIDSLETSVLAAAKKKGYVRRYNRAGAERGWHFLTGDEPSIRKLADVVGFHYAYDTRTDTYAHPAGILVLTPEGKISRYFYGIEIPPRDIRLGLIEASERRIGSPVDKLLLLCFHYDPATGTYNFVIMQALRVLGVATAAALGTFIIVMVRRDRRSASGVVAGA
jgi:protein SCO1